MELAVDLPRDPYYLQMANEFMNVIKQQEIDWFRRHNLFSDLNFKCKLYGDSYKSYEDISMNVLSEILKHAIEYGRNVTIISTTNFRYELIDSAFVITDPDNWRKPIDLPCLRGFNLITDLGI